MTTKEESGIIHRVYDPAKDNLQQIILRAVKEGNAGEVRLGGFSILGKQKRDCNGCTECCDLLGITALKKYTNQICKYEKNHRCSIHWSKEKFPESCNLYECMWALGNFGEDYKPRRVGFVVTFGINESNGTPGSEPTPGEGEPFASIAVRTKGFIDIPKLKQALNDLYKALEDVKVIHGLDITVYRKGFIYEGKIIRKEGVYEDLSYALRQPGTPMAIPTVGATNGIKQA